MAEFCHQLRVPINGLLGMMDLMLEIADGDLREHLLATRLCTRELAENVNAALEFSRPLRHRPSTTPFDLCEAIEAVVAGQAERASARRAELYCHFPEVLPPIVEGPLVELRRALSLLLALLLTMSRDGEVGVSATHLQGPRGILLSVTLRSTTACLTPVQLDQFRVLLKGRERTLAPGSLELLMSSRILQNIGGEAEVHKDERSGLIFEVTAPLTLPGPPFETGDLMWDERLAGRSAVVVSSHAGVSNSLLGLLRQFGLHVDSAPSLDGGPPPWAALVDVDSSADLPAAARAASHRISFGRRRTDGTSQPDLEKPVRRYVLYDRLVSMLMPDRDRTPPPALPPVCELMLG